jgi:porphobilinogen synthase
MTAFPTRRPRRLRQSPALRRLVAEHDLTPRRLVLPVFVKEGIAAAQPIASMPGVAQHPLDAVPALVDEAVAAGIGGIMLFGVPADRDAIGSGATDPDGILNRAIAAAATAAAGRSPCRRTCASTSSPTTATAAFSPPTGPSTTTRRSRSTRAWRRPGRGGR